jgi:hypothetical protein
LAGVFLSVLLAGIALLASCSRDPDPPKPPPAPPAAESRRPADTDAPDVHAIVAREGDHLVLIADVAAIDRRGREVSITGTVPEPDSPAAKASPAIRHEDQLTVEVRIPAATKSVRLTGSLRGGPTWSTTISTDLDAR